MAKRKTIARRPRKPRPQNRRKPSIDFSVTGLIYSTMMMFIGLAAVNTQANLLFGVFGLMIGILIVSFLISGLVIRKLQIERVLPDHVIVGRPSVFHYNVTNDKRFWPSLSVTVAEVDDLDAFARPPQAYVLHAANRNTASVPAEVFPLRRGLFELNRYQLSTSFPFGFIKRAIDNKRRDAILVLPAIGTMSRELMRRFKSAQSSGMNVRPRSGGDDEFFGVREYRNGENPRRIYWKRSAGAGPLVVKDMTKVAPPKVVVMVDTYRIEKTAEAYAAVEKAIAAAATIIDTCLAADLTVGLAVWSDGWVSVEPGRGKRHRVDMLASLGKLPPNRRYDRYALIDKTRSLIKHDTTAVIVGTAGGRTADIPTGRGGFIVLGSNEIEHNFKFDPSIDFSLGWSGD